MSKLAESFTSTDFIGFLIILAMVLFKITGHNGSLDTAVAIIVGYYFGKRHITAPNVSS
jgi:hypothetical protein